MIKKSAALIFATMLLVVALFFSQFKYKSNPLVSPVVSNSKQKFADKLWFPKDQVLAYRNYAQPKITAKSAFFVETKNGDVLFEKNPHQRLPVASLTKIMTAIVTLENKNLSDQLIVSERAVNTEPDNMLLKAHEKLTVKELLDGVFLVSANDAAEVFAERVVGSREQFIDLMNSRSKSLGMVDTLFINPTGLDEDGKEQYSSAFDVVLMARYAVNKWPHLIDITDKPYIYIPETNNHQSYDLYTGINLLTTYPGVVGFKTGFTYDAGLTLVTLARKNGTEVMGVLLDSTNRRDDAKILLDYSFDKLSEQY